ncbi:MAG: hypothetical protein KBT01_04020 [Clostridiales bacterium]|nr:hypothetical protein [Candidatus Blautia equi]
MTQKIPPGGMWLPHMGKPSLFNEEAGKKEGKFILQSEECHNVELDMRRDK